MVSMDADDQLRLAIDAAVAAGAMAGYGNVRPEVLQHTNNVVVWLAPHPVVAKVGVWSYSRDRLQRESELCAELAAVGAPVAVPLRDSGLRSEHGLRRGAGRFGEAHAPVSLWRQLDLRGEPPTATGTAALLHRVHQDLARVAPHLHEPLPSFLSDVVRARDAAVSGEWLGTLDPDDLSMLQTAFDRWVALLTGIPDERHQPLHGEPHAGNVLSTSHGLVMIDFESACVGPVEWDLANVTPEVTEAYVDLAASAGDPPIDRRRLAVMRALNSARVATWCWASTHESMREHGVVHLAAVRAAVEGGL